MEYYDKENVLSNIFRGGPMDWVSIHRFHHQFTDTNRDPHSPKEGFLFSHVMWIFDTFYIKYKVTYTYKDLISSLTMSFVTLRFM